MLEYWSSARKACLRLLPGEKTSRTFHNSVPSAFLKLRPWVHKGWEMVLIAEEVICPNSLLNKYGPSVFSQNYNFFCQQVLQERQWSTSELQAAIETIRREEISNHLQDWLALHKPFPMVVDRLNKLKAEEIDFAVLTTKGANFTSEILSSLGLQPNLLFGHESGDKHQVLTYLAHNRVIKGFIEDRRETLETVLAKKSLEKLPCYLASWGYLKPNDKKDLPANIYLLEPQTFSAPLASWR